MPLQWPLPLRVLGLFARPSQAFVPHIKVDDIRQLNFPVLKEIGYRGIVVDKDNCITKPHSDVLLPHLQEAWNSAVRTFGASNVLIVSNSSGTRKDPSQLSAEALHRSTQVPVLLHTLQKPFCYNAVANYFRLPPTPNAPTYPPTGDLLRPLSSTPEAPIHPPEPRGLIVIGDRLLTDTVLAALLPVPQVPGSLHRPTAASSTTATVSDLDHVNPSNLTDSMKLESNASSSVVPATLPPPPPIPPYHLSILTTSLPQPRDVRPLRIFERIIERLVRRFSRDLRAATPAEQQMAGFRAMGVVKSGRLGVEEGKEALVEKEGGVAAAAMPGVREPITPRSVTRALGRGVWAGMKMAGRGIVRGSRWAWRKMTTKVATTDAPADVVGVAGKAGAGAGSKIQEKVVGAVVEGGTLLDGGGREGAKRAVAGE